MNHNSGTITTTNLGTITTSGYYTAERTPEVFITKNKNRLKIYANNKIYLNDKEEFELEFFNPNNFSVAAEISINGISSSKKLVIKPGKRIFLDRFLDEQKKFLFETYKVDNNKEVKEAIKNNGFISINFFKEQGTINYQPYNITWTNIPYNKNYPYTHQYYHSDITCTTSALIDNKSCDCNKSNKIETGRVEKGDTSNQQLINSYENFSYFSFHSIEYQILPESELKNIYITDIKKYCTGCGTRIKKTNWKFCPSCGTKL